MPDGQRRQVDVPPTASVKDLKSTIAANLSSWTPSESNQPESWDLGFAGSVLNDGDNLTDYHIPDAYDHASGLLRTISDSAHADATKKVEALDKACTIVAGISRGENDMERLISAVFDDDTPAKPDQDPPQQPTLTAMRRSRRSRIPSLNFSALPPLGPLPTGPSSAKSPRNRAFPSAPPTPSQLIRKLSASRPDLYDPAVAARPPTSSPDLKRGISWFTNPPTGTGTATGTDLPAPSQGRTAAPGPVQPPTSAAQSNPAPASGGGSGELKRGNTWFTDVISAFGNSVPQGGRPKPQYDGDASSEGDDGTAHPDDDVEGDSEGDIDEDKHARDTSNPSASGPKTEAVKVGPSPAKDPSSYPPNSAAAEKDSGPSPPRAPPEKAADGVASNVQGELAENANAGSEKSSGAGSRAPETTNDGASGPGGQDKDKQPGGTTPIDTSKQIIGLEPEQPSMAEDVKQPKKRGRKRKNPHLTDEQRKAQRQAQNRESAKMSRIRRKNMTIEYEKRVNTLEGENENLRDTVAALTERLEMLQSLLTISVQKRPAVPVPVGQGYAGQGMHMPVGVPGMSHGVAPQTQVHAIPQHVSQVSSGAPTGQAAHHAQQVANLQYKNF